MALATVPAVLLGISPPGRGGRRWGGSQGAALSGYSIPEFWLGQLLILLFAVGWAGCRRRGTARCGPRPRAGGR